MTKDPRPRPVVVGADASEESLEAVRFAADEARRRGAPLRIVHALPVSFGGTNVAPGDLDVPQLLHAGAGEVLHWAAETVARERGQLSVTTAVERGDPAGVLRDESQHAQLVVVGSRGVGGVAGLLLGSTASALVADSSCPVVVLPEETAVRLEDRRSVVVGVEGGPGDDEVLAFAFAEAAARRTDLVAVHAWQDVVLETAFRSLGPLVDWAGVQADEERALAEALAGWAGKEPDVPVREVVVREKTARALVSASLTAQLLVVGHHRRRRLASTTHAVVHRSSCPVAVVPLAARGES
jgi:nucleotide-binding universal stress UspA family protein